MCPPRLCQRVGTSPTLESLPEIHSEFSEFETVLAFDQLLPLLTSLVGRCIFHNLHRRRNLRSGKEIFRKDING